MHTGTVLLLALNLQGSLQGLVLPSSWDAWITVKQSV